MAGDILTYYLYKITNKTSDKCYIGVSVNPERRWAAHCRPSSGCTLMNRAIQKHGRDSFNFEVLCQGSKSYIYELESKAITAYQSTGHGYNIQSGGLSGTFTMKEPSEKDESIYASGFWFNTARDAYRTLGIPKRTFFARKLAGTVGQTCITRAPKHRSRK